MAEVRPVPLVLAVIAVLAFLFNGVICLVVLRKRAMLKQSYNVFIFALAIVDTLTGIFLLSSPLYVLGQESVAVPEGTAGQLFCRIIFRGYLLWVFTKMSIALVACMTIERWFAIAMPIRYQLLFTTRRVVYYIVGTFIISILWEFDILFETPMVLVNSTPSCVFKPAITNKAAQRGWSTTASVASVFLPFLFMMLCYLHLRFLFSKQINNCQNVTLRRQAELEMKLSRMNLAVMLCMAICQFPNYISYVLFLFDFMPYDSIGHDITVVLSMLNSCINPLIYIATSRFYRNEVMRLVPLRKQNGLGRRELQEQHRATSEPQVGDEILI